MGACASRPKDVDDTNAPVEAPTAEVEQVAPETKDEGEKEAPLLDLSEPKVAEEAEAKPAPAPAPAVEEPPKEAKEEKAPSKEAAEEKAKPEAAPSTEVKTEAPLVTV